MHVYNDLAADPAFANLRSLLTAPNGLVVKYQRRAARFAFDQNFFREMDRQGMWIPIPYPRDILHAEHHREGFPTQFATQHANLCRTLRGHID
jgi:hypothetical protein